MFVPGRLYSRRELHKTFGGQRQGGISTPAARSIILLFTGEAGEQHGYHDGWSKDGLFLYTGEGQRGDMQFVRGNQAVRDHANDGKDLHLFEYPRHARDGLVRYVDQMVCTGYGFREAPDTTGAKRKAIIFELSPIQEFQTPADQASPNDPMVDASNLENESLDELRSKAVSASSSGRDPRERRALVRQRSHAIKAYVLKRAGGQCEGCGCPAPFLTARGEHYLEPHHIRRLSDGGPDDPRWVIATCPNCHRRAHYSKDAEAYNRRLAEIVGRLEQ